jgi:DNA-binding response OmpR family regulator
MESILLVEDADRIASFIVKGLQAHGFECVRASSGEEALAMVSAADFSLMILDIGLPGIDGFEVLNKLRGQGFDLPVIVLTARDSVDNTVASFSGGADDYMGKPFSFDELLARVKARIRKAQIPIEATEIIELGSVRLDIRTRKASRHGSEHELTAREFGILEFLMMHPGQVISREQLLSRVWSYDHDPESNVVDVYVRYLRQKLGQEIIQTVRGAGYRMPSDI